MSAISARADQSSALYRDTNDLVSRGSVFFLKFRSFSMERKRKVGELSDPLSFNESTDARSTPIRI